MYVGVSPCTNCKMDKRFMPRRCVYCQGHFKDPKVLPCFHILCRECIRSLQIRGVKELKCPVNRCNKKFTCKEMDPESLPDASVVYHSQDLHRFKVKLEMGEVICDPCWTRGKKKKNPAIAQCHQCKYICQGCKDLHDEDKVRYSDHEVVLFLELSQQRDDSLHMEVLKRSRSTSFVQTTKNKCREHQQQPNTSFCLDCKTYCCPVCIDATHAKHHYRASSIAATECTEILKDRVPLLQLAKNKRLDAVESIKQRKDAVADHCVALTSSVDATFERLAKILQRRKEELKCKVSELTKRKINNLSLQQLDLERAAGELDRMSRFTERVLLSSTERELLAVYPFLHDRTEESLECASDGLDLLPVEAVNVAFKSSSGKDLMDLCRRNLDVYLQQANPASCSAEGDGLQTAQTMHYSQFSVNVVDMNHRPCSSLQNVVVKVKRCKNESEIPAFVHDKGVGRYHVSYCPEFRGKHEISVSVNDKAIAGSPFELNVDMPRSQLGISQGCIVDVTQPRGIVFTPKKILVCEWNGNRIIEMDMIGRRSCVLGSEDILHPASLALSTSGDIFVVEGVGPIAGVKKWDKSGKLLKSACGEGSEPGKFKSPRGMKIGPNNEVFVCDRDNGRIQVFDMDLRYLRCVDLNNKLHFVNSKPNDLAFDQSNNVYITDYSNNCVHKLDPNEQHLATFSKSMDGKLAGPECIAVDAAGYLYVTESHSHRVSVFTTSGECVKAFGCKGKGDGELNFPMGIAIDETGDIYVCELLNNRIQVF